MKTFVPFTVVELQWELDKKKRIQDLDKMQECLNRLEEHQESREPQEKISEEAKKEKKEMHQKITDLIASQPWYMNLTIPFLKINHEAQKKSMEDLYWCKDIGRRVFSNSDFKINTEELDKYATATEEQLRQAL
jgi:hypothetical protein